MIGLLSMSLVCKFPSSDISTFGAYADPLISYSERFYGVLSPVSQ